jgi:hypothetical protein
MFSSIRPAQGRPSLRRLAGIAVVATASIWLAGCAGVRAIDSDVQSYSTLQQLPAPPTYRLQLLPSQVALGPQFDTVVQQAEASLAGVGLRRDDSQGSVIAQIDAQARYIPDSWLMPGSPYNPYGGLGWGPGWGWRGGMVWRDTGPSLHYRAVQLTLRDVQTQQVVYETSARYEDVWVDDQVIYRILFDSALNGFPKPPQGPRRVSTTTGGKPAPTPAAPAAAVNPATPGVKSK